MGIYDRDYERQGQWRDSYGGGGGIQLRFPETSVNRIVLVTLLAYLVEVVFFSSPDGNLWVRWLSLWSNWFYFPWEAYQLLTYSLVHDPHSIWHVAGNMFGVWMFGRQLEQRFGSREFMLYYLGAVLAGGLAITLYNVVVPSAQPFPTLGASAGTVAVILLYALLYPHQTVLLFAVFPIPMWVLGAFIVGQDVMRALSTDADGVSFQGHLGGAAFAAAYHFQRWRLSNWVPQEFKLPSLKRRPKLRVHTAPDDEQNESQDKLRDEVDRILKKISDQGSDSLTSKEKRLMQRASREFKGRRQL
ncbi:Rhomboid family protein [Posidoniimonas corsicana]|uniref:Rhomboid family protein n=1 Tax=Posidoniimonas corsicana TaxID=1938618 RepID=A0A5C5UY83_9BACT|nr:rhomboid family intramembrane serine protease [Posidoniimonas corsicana]TWT30432.1 Rhomboid family protein [Posidoniimonas corsicana]